MGGLGSSGEWAIIFKWEYLSKEMMKKILSRNLGLKLFLENINIQCEI